MSSRPATEGLMAPPLRLAVGITGHRESNPAFRKHRATIAVTLARLLGVLEAAAGGTVKPRLHSLLAHGADLMAVEMALGRSWQVSAPLPFGPALNVAINAHPDTAADARALLAGSHDCAPAVLARARHISDLAARTRQFALAEEDERLVELMLASMDCPGDPVLAQDWWGAASDRAALAGRVMIEQSDIVIAIWDGRTRGSVGGTRHTIAAALDAGAPVIWIDAARPDGWHVLDTPEALATLPVLAESRADADIAPLVAAALAADEGSRGAENFVARAWRPHSKRRFHAYRRIETLFGGRARGSRMASLVQHYERPETVGTGSGAWLLKAARDLPGGDAAMPQRLEHDILRRFAWADGISTYLSDAYRGGMVASFGLSSLAIIGGIAYLPFVSAMWKWPFALFEFVLLAAILAITALGNRFGWHSRWFETRRVAEYLRHTPILLLLGSARPPGRWPRGARTSWPERFARSVLRETGLPAVTVTPGYLRAALETLLSPHVTGQRDYHRGKAARLTAAHHNLDKVSEALFTLAVLSVSAYLTLALLGWLGIVSPHIGEAVAKPFTFLGVVFPTLGAALAGIRYFGDFERFAAISTVTAEKLDGIATRIAVLRAAPDSELTFTRVADIAHAVDEVVVTEIENWQAVFGGKGITVPV